VSHWCKFCELDYCVADYTQKERDELKITAKNLIYSPNKTDREGEIGMTPFTAEENQIELRLRDDSSSS
jgi:hypothetical protein